MWVIEFRNGSLFENLEADHGVTIDKAMKFSSKKEVEAFMDKHFWIYFNGGMAIEIHKADSYNG